MSKCKSINITLLQTCGYDIFIQEGLQIKFVQTDGTSV